MTSASTTATVSSEGIRGIPGHNDPLSVSVVIPTYNRPDCIRENLTRLASQEPRPVDAVVVDASPGTETQRVVEELGYAWVVYLRNAEGRGNTPNSRNLALLHVGGEIIAFLDDDAFVHPGWSASLIEAYREPDVGGVAGRSLNKQPGEAELGRDRIGRYLPDGRMTGNFAADPGGLVEIDHMIGCNMSLRSSVVAELGGFKDDFRAGPFGICEETEICIRARRLGYRLLFQPAAVADHIGAQQPGGRRFSPKYSFYHAKNNLVMVLRNAGIGVMAVRHVLAVGGLALAGAMRKLAGAAAHLLAAWVGLAVGLMVGGWLVVTRGIDPVRRDAKGESIREALRNRASQSAADVEPRC